jgi:hypothetical protein
MVFLGLLVPSKKTSENTPKPKNGKANLKKKKMANYYPPGHPNKGTFNTIVVLVVLDVLGRDP